MKVSKNKKEKYSLLNLEKVLNSNNNSTAWHNVVQENVKHVWT